MLSAILPLPFVLPSVLPPESPIAFSLVIYEVSHILLAVVPGELALAMHLILVPLPAVVLVGPRILPKAVDLIKVKVPFIHTPI